MTTAQVDPRLVGARPGFAGAVADFRRRLTQGELGSLPVAFGLAVVWIYFWLENERFLSSFNLTSLVLQIAGLGTISVGIVLVLLLGEIDLSVGALSGFAAAVMAVVNVDHGWPGWLAILLALGVGAAVGLVQGVWITKLRMPAFVVTLAGFLAWSGALLFTLGDTGSKNIRDENIVDLTGTFFSDPVSWALAVAVMVAYVAGVVFQRARRAKAGLPLAPARTWVVRALLVVVGLTVATAVFTDDRGLPLAAVIFGGLVVLFDLLSTRTRFGRHVYAVGGNAEAARRAGIRVDAVRVTVFTLASTLAAAGGVLLAARGRAVSQSSGGGDLLLNAIAAAVIGGTSLFGGKGSVWSALLGALVIGSIANGMDLLGQSSDVKFMVTGAVLLVAASIDAVARRGRQAAGRA
ncbi:MAG TPA: hypothetical protein VF640_06085 [Acidimicrobiales bacterium]